MKKQLSILLVDDHPIFLKGLVEVMKETFTEAQIDSFTSPDKALEQVNNYQYDIAISDLDMPGMNGMALITALKKRKPEIKTILLTMHKEQDVMRSALAIGIDGYVLKDDVVDELVIAVEEVLKGNKYISELDFMADYNEQNQDLKALTKTELLILKEIAENKTSRTLADELSVSLKTIENHRANISRKLQLQGSNSLLKFAINNKHLL